jgi:LPS export ABC transporter protein LptC
MKAYALFIIVLFLSGCSSEKVKPSINVSINESRQVAEGWDENVAFSDSGITKAVLFYRHLRKFEQPAETLMDTIKVNFYDQLGHIASVLTANKGKADDLSNDLFAVDSVVAVNDSGVTLKTQELMWKNKERKIVTDKFVTIISPKEKIQGYGLESDQNLRNYTIYNITYVTRLDTAKPVQPVRNNSGKK